MYHYVYKITNLNPPSEKKYYIGVRSSKVHPSLDLNYMGSSKNLKKDMENIGKDFFKKDILKIFNSRSEAIKEEISLHKKYNVSKDVEYYNLVNNEEFLYDAKGRISVRDQSGKTLSIPKNDPNYNSDIYVSVNKGFVTCKDENNKSVRVTKEEFYSSQKYLSPNIGKIPCINSLGEKILIDKNDERFKNGEYWSVHKGKIACTDSNGEFKFVTKEEFESNKDLKGISSEKIKGEKNGRAKKIKIYDSEGNVRFECNGNFENVCKDNNLPFTALKKSYLNGGLPVYLNKKGKSEALKRGNLEFVGWSAKII